MSNQGEAFSLTLRDGEMAGYRFGAQGRPPLLFSHATGLCASAYRNLFAALGDRYDAFALDLRGHGRSKLPADPASLWSWDVYAADLLAALEAIPARFKVSGDWTLAGHSMGGVASLLAAGERSDISALRMIDPPLMPVPLWVRRSPLWPLLAERMPILRGARSRRSRWSNREEVLKSYETKRFFRDWAPGGLPDYLDDALTDDPEGVRLSCTPDWEAATFGAQRHDVWPAVRSHLGRGRELTIWGAGGPDSPFASAIRKRMRKSGANVIENAAAGHLWPLERPHEASQFIADPSKIDL